jgi:outer membrane protein OmpA-like peptidoglycan-associated protein
MSSSILNSLSSTLDARAVGEIASRLGEPYQAVSQGLEYSTAALVGALSNKAGNSAWINELHQFLSAAPSSVNASELAAAVTGSGQAPAATESLLDSGKKFLSLAFGGKQSSIIDALTSSTGLRSGVVSSLMTMAAPLLMTTLGRRVREESLSPSGLAGLLAQEGESARSFLPASFSTLLDATPATAQTTPSPAIGATPEPESTSRGWLWVLTALFLLIPFLFWTYYRSRHPPVVVVHHFIVRVLPSRVSLNIPDNGMEARLLAFIQDPTRGADQVTWIDFDRLLFDPDAATLLPGSQEQLANIAAILKAYPNVNVRIGGYTDNTGDPQHNMELSAARANEVMADLVALGISPARMEAQGYGDQYPVADNSTAEGRAKNRRISIRVTQK